METWGELWLHDGHRPGETVAPLFDGEPPSLDTPSPPGDLKPSPDAGSIGGSTSCSSPAVVDMAKAPVVIKLDFSTAGCADPGLGGFCSCLTGRQHVVRVVNVSGDLSVDCTGGGDKVYIDSEKGSSLCPPVSPLCASLACGMGSSISHGYGDYLIVCRRNTATPVVSLELTLE